MMKVTIITANATFYKVAALQKKAKITSNETESIKHTLQLLRSVS